MTKAFAKIPATIAGAEPASSTIELLCPADNLVSLRAAVDNAADWVLLDYRRTGDIHGSAWIGDRHAAMTKGINYAHDRRCKVVLGLEARPQPTSWPLLRAAIDHAGCSGVDAVILSDPALMLYAAGRYQELQLHYAAPQSALHPESINYFQRQFGISRVVLPRVVSLTQVRQITENTTVDIEVAGFGPLCAVVSSRHSMAAGISIEAIGDEVTDRRVRRKAPAGAASTGRCATVEDATNDQYYATTGLPQTSTLQLLPQLSAMGVRAIKIEAQDGVPGHLAQALRVWREAIDSCMENHKHYSVKPSWIAKLNRLAKVHRPC